MLRRTPAPGEGDEGMDTQRLKRLPLFEELDRKALERLAAWTDEVDVAPGKRLVEEGALPHEFFVIEQGTAEVLHAGTVVAELGPGDFFGELALLEEQRRTATVVATTPLHVVVMFVREFEQMEREMPELAERIRASVAARKQGLAEVEGSA
jgi:CRP/FNR family transcriptional regulator, cyclic AMP receptor protein